ncbi:MAG: lysophospholipid acyltransferase family protein [Stappiaceae bacterium]
MLKSLGRSPVVLKTVGSFLAYYLLLVRKTSSMVIDPPDLYDQAVHYSPVIVAMWHGQHFMMPFARPDGWDVRVMISRSADGEINAIAAKKLGIGLIRASGAQKRHQMRKRGGMRGFIEAMRALKEGGTVALTADVPKGPARVSGVGIIQLAKHSGRPIIPIAIATSRHIDLNTWDKASINLPFSRIGLAAGELIYVPKDADDATIETLRAKLTTMLDETTEHAYAMTGKKG